MTLRECTKTELIYVVRYLARNTDALFLNRALLDVANQREKKKYDKAKRLTELSMRKWKEYTELLAPYEGKLLTEVPGEVFNEAYAALQAAKKADKQWEKLMDIKR